MRAEFHRISPGGVSSRAGSSGRRGDSVSTSLAHVNPEARVRQPHNTPATGTGILASDTRHCAVPPPAGMCDASRRTVSLASYSLAGGRREHAARARHRGHCRHVRSHVAWGISKRAISYINPTSFGRHSDIVRPAQPVCIRPPNARARMTPIGHPPPTGRPARWRSKPSDSRASQGAPEVHPGAARPRIHSPTLDRYGHLMPDAHAAEARKLDRLVFGGATGSRATGGLGPDGVGAQRYGEDATLPPGPPRGPAAEPDVAVS